MKWTTLLPLAVSVSLIPATLAWEVSWTDSSGKKHQESGQGPSDCIQIDNPEGNLFKIDAQGEQGINMLLFTNDKCSGEAAGMATQIFSKESSQHLLGFQVVDSSSTTTKGATKTASDSTANSTSKSTGTLNNASATTFPSSPSQSSTVGADESMTLLPILPTTTASTTSEGTASVSSSTSANASSTSTDNASSKLVSSGIMRAMGGILGLMILL